MKQRDPPEIIIRGWRSETSFKGEEAIRAAGWSLHFMLIASTLRIVAIIPFGATLHAMVKWWLS
jgi:hypothetical protein